VTMAEWHCEILESYCGVLLLAHQLGKPVSHIPEPKGQDLRARRRSMGLPDVGELAPQKRTQPQKSAAQLTEAELESLVARVTRQVLKEFYSA